MGNDDYSKDGDVLTREQEQELLRGRLQGTASRYSAQVGGRRHQEGHRKGTHAQAGFRDCNKNVMWVRGLSVHVCPIHTDT